MYYCPVLIDSLMSPGRNGGSILRNICRFGQHIAALRRYRVVESKLSHPNILQIYGVASSCNVHATVFHGGAAFDLPIDLDLHIEHLDLTPFQKFLDLYRHSPMLTVYIWAYVVRASVSFDAKY